MAETEREIDEKTGCYVGTQICDIGQQYGNHRFGPGWPCHVADKCRAAEDRVVFCTEEKSQPLPDAIKQELIKMFEAAGIKDAED